jgi:hypothetical protein
MGLLVSDCAGTPQRAEGLCRQRAGLRVLKRVLRGLALFAVHLLGRIAESEAGVKRVGSLKG